MDLNEFCLAFIVTDFNAFGEILGDEFLASREMSNLKS